MYNQLTTEQEGPQLTITQDDQGSKAFALECILTLHRSWICVQHSQRNSVEGEEISTYVCRPKYMPPCQQLTGEVTQPREGSPWETIVSERKAGLLDKVDPH